MHFCTLVLKFFFFSFLFDLHFQEYCLVSSALLIVAPPSGAHFIEYGNSEITWLSLHLFHVVLGLILTVFEYLGTRVPPEPMLFNLRFLKKLLDSQNLFYKTLHSVSPGHELLSCILKFTKSLQKYFFSWFLTILQHKKAATVLAYV